MKTALSRVPFSYQCAFVEDVRTFVADPQAEAVLEEIKTLLQTPLEEEGRPPFEL